MRYLAFRYFAFAILLALPVQPAFARGHHSGSVAYHHRAQHATRASSTSSSLRAPTRPSRRPCSRRNSTAQFPFASAAAWHNAAVLQPMQHLQQPRRLLTANPPSSPLGLFRPGSAAGGRERRAGLAGASRHHAREPLQSARGQQGQLRHHADPARHRARHGLFRLGRRPARRRHQHDLRGALPRRRLPRRRRQRKPRRRPLRPRLWRGARADAAASGQPFGFASIYVRRANPPSPTRVAYLGSHHARYRRHGVGGPATPAPRRCAGRAPRRRRAP